MNCYIHIPFCNSKCNYCRFASLGKTGKFLIEKYLLFLIKEIKNFNSKNKTLKTIYFGGGTPSVLEKKDLEKIINTLKDKFIFDKNIEITLETTPQNVNFKNLISWQELGINRISIGIQTLNNKSLKEVNRGSNKEIFKALDEIKKYSDDSLVKNYKIINFSIDFIIGLPFTKPLETKKDIEKILKKYNFIKHISVYLLEDYYEINTEIEEKNNFEKIIYPENWKKNSFKQEDFLNDYIETKKFLEKKGFFSYEISNFSKKNFKCKHNIGYWNHIETIGFGLSASSLLKNEKNIFFRKTNSSNFLEYYNSKIEEKYFLNDEDIFLEKIMFSFRTGGLEENLYKKLDNKKINEFLKLGYLKIKNKKLILEEKGVLVLDYIIKETLKN